MKKFPKNIRLRKALRRAEVKTWLVVFGFIVAAFTVPSVVFAQAPRIVVQFENAPLPLFDKANFAPGETETRFIKVTNNTESEKEVILEAINYDPCSILPFVPCFAKKLAAKIYSGGETYFDKNLSDLFGAGEISLGKLPAGAMKEYHMSVLFPAGEDDNEYQNAKTGNFDLLVGFRGEEGQGSGGENGGGGTPSGGEGGGAVLQGLQINNEGINGSTGDGMVSFLWDTSYASYGHIIYGLDTGATYVLDLGKPNFGYAASWPSDPFAPGHDEVYGKTQHHIMDVSGLVPGETYRYRIVSHASPPTVGYEHMFTVPGGVKKADAAEADEMPEVIARGIDEDGTIVTVTTGGTEQPVKITETPAGQNPENSSAANGEKESTDPDSRAENNFAAAGIIGGVSIFWWLLIALVATVGGYYILKKK